MSSSRPPISAVIAGFNRIPETLHTIKQLKRCNPAPAEILVHVDGNQSALGEAVRRLAPDARVLLSETNLGPGGARNKLIVAASHELVASFDDDSYPLDVDYFARVEELAKLFPEAGIVCARVVERGDPINEPGSTEEQWVADFSGGGCVYRRSVFLKTSGYVPLPVAYGMEEVDLAIRLHEAGGKILKSPRLRVFHDTDRSRHAKPEITARSIANIALLCFLRYPLSLWWVGGAQCVSRLRWLLRNGRRAGIIRGVLMIPRHLWVNRGFRRQVSRRALASYLALRRAPKKAQPA